MNTPHGNEVCLPADALGVPDEQEQLVPPEVGDAVTVTLEGKVTRVGGGNVYFQPTSANGNPIENKAPMAMSPEDEDREMEHMVAQARQEGGY